MKQIKAGYQPSDLLCPITYTWWPLSDILEKLNENKYVQFATDETSCIVAPNDSEITSLIRRLSLLLHGKEVKIDVFILFLILLIIKKRNIINHYIYYFYICNLTRISLFCLLLYLLINQTNFSIWSLLIKK